MSSQVDSYLIAFDPKAEKQVLKTDTSSIDVQKLWKLARSDGLKANTARVIHQDEYIAGIVSLGSGFSTKTPEAKAEAFRQATATGLKKLKDAGAKNVGVDVNKYPQAAAVATHLANFSFTLKTDEEKDAPQIRTATKLSGDALKQWDTGVTYAYAQNLARELKELPANIMTPTAFCKRIQEEFKEVPDTEIVIRDQEWAQGKGMRTFLSVAKGSSEPPKFLEIHYNGAPKEDAPLVFVGKGITFDSGGISLKPATDMKLMRADMGGAAAVTSAALAIAKLKLPLNLAVCVPLCENMPGPAANKPGDIIYAMNGKSVEVDNTDAEGRLILSDALHYANTTYKPETLIDVATLTGAMLVAMGHVYTGIFTNSESLWNELHAAGEAEYDRFWRMPLDEEFGPQIYSSNADLCNTGGRPGGSCTAALFLKAFVDGVEPENGKPGVRWAHLDIAGSMEAVREGPYQKKGMTGRATRGLIEFAKRMCEA